MGCVCTSTTCSAVYTVVQGYEFKENIRVLSSDKGDNKTFDFSDALRIKTCQALIPARNI